VTLHALACRYGRAPSDYAGLTGFAAYALDAAVLNAGAREEEAYKKHQQFARPRKGVR
jgi:hypothetical protein